MGLYNAVIFDMDGVLVDSEPYHIKIEKQLFEKLGLAVSDEEHARYTGTATDVMWAEIIGSRNLDVSIDEMVNLNYRESEQYFSSLPQIQSMPGLVDLLEWLKLQGIVTAVASSSVPRVVDIIMGKTGLRNYFDQVVNSRLVGKSKPSPDIFLYAAQLLAVPPKNCIVIEDSTNGIKAAKAAGMYCFAYCATSSCTKNPELADSKVNDFYQLRSLLENMVCQ